MSTFGVCASYHGSIHRTTDGGSENPAHERSDREGHDHSQAPVPKRRGHDNTSYSEEEPAHRAEKLRQRHRALRFGISMSWTTSKKEPRWQSRKLAQL